MSLPAVELWFAPIQPGDRVYVVGSATGTYAQFCVCNKGQVAFPTPMVAYVYMSVRMAFMGRCGPSRHGCHSLKVLASGCPPIPLTVHCTLRASPRLEIRYLYAWRALVLQSVFTQVLIHGASGSVGLVAVQLAKADGMIVVGTAGTPVGENAVREAGADVVLNHREPNYLQEVM
jgi:NADPH:quinone reductase-like Zn-dependent oxidoreductase